jgi:prolipoprotein diacylglyceryltransferase
MSDRGDEAPGWFFRRENVNKLWYALLLVCGLLTISEFLYEHHPHFDIERIPEFFEIFGFLAFMLIVFAGRLLRTIIMRDEDYYERD